MLDAIFIVVTTPEEAIKRDRENSLTEKFGETTNPESIARLVKLFKNAYKELRQKRDD